MLEFVTRTPLLEKPTFSLTVDGLLTNDDAPIKLKSIAMGWVSTVLTETGRVYIGPSGDDKRLPIYSLQAFHPLTVQLITNGTTTLALSVIGEVFGIGHNDEFRLMGLEDERDYREFVRIPVAERIKEMVIEDECAFLISVTG